MNMRSILLVVVATSFIGCEDGVRQLEAARIWHQYQVDTTGVEPQRGALYLEERKSYDGRGAPTEISSSFEGVPAYRIVYQEITPNTPVRADYYDANDSLSSYYVYEFDRQWREVRYENRDLATDSVIYDVEFRYPADSVSTSGYIDSAGQYRWNYRYYFDDFGNETRAQFLSGEDTLNIVYVIDSRHNDQRWRTRRVIGPENNIWYFEEQTFEYSE